MKSCIETFMGEIFNPLRPKQELIHLVDVAHALSNQCRFSGHSQWHYSVAQHSYLVSKLLERWDAEPLIQMHGLFHDGSETYLVDLATPLKKHRFFGRSYRAVEGPLQRAVCRRFGLRTSMPSIVGAADAVLLATEVRDLMHKDRPYWKKLAEKPDPKIKIEKWSQDKAKRRFLQRYVELKEQLCGT